MAASPLPVRNLGRGEAWESSRRMGHPRQPHRHHSPGLRKNRDDEEEGLVDEEPRMAQHQGLARNSFEGNGNGNPSRWPPTTQSPRKRSRPMERDGDHDGYRSEVSSNRYHQHPHHQQHRPSESSRSFVRDEPASGFHSSSSQLQQRRPEPAHRASVSDRRFRDEPRREANYNRNLSNDRGRKNLDDPHSHQYKNNNNNHHEEMLPNRRGGFEDRFEDRDRQGRKDGRYDRDFPTLENQERYDDNRSPRGDRDYQKHHRESDYSYHSRHQDQDQRSMDRHGYNRPAYNQQEQGSNYRSATSERGTMASRFESTNSSNVNHHHGHNHDHHRASNHPRDHREPRATEEWGRDRDSKWGDKGDRNRDRWNHERHRAPPRYNDESDDCRGNRHEDEHRFARGEVDRYYDHGRDRGNPVRGGVQYEYTSGRDLTNNRDRYREDRRHQTEGNHGEGYDRRGEAPRRPDANTTDRRASDQTYAPFRESDRRPPHPSEQQRITSEGNSSNYARDYGYGEDRGRDHRRVGDQDYSDSHRGHQMVHRPSSGDNLSHSNYLQRSARDISEQSSSSTMFEQRRSDDRNRYSREAIVNTEDRRQHSSSLDCRHQEQRVLQQPPFESPRSRNLGEGFRGDHYQKMESSRRVADEGSRPFASNTRASTGNGVHYGEDIKTHRLERTESYSSNIPKGWKRSVEDTRFESLSSHGDSTPSPPKKRLCQEPKHPPSTASHSGRKSDAPPPTTGVPANASESAAGVTPKEDIGNIKTGDPALSLQRPVPKKKANSGIPMRWLKPSNKPKNIQKVKTSAPNPLPTPNKMEEDDSKTNVSHESMSEKDASTMKKPQCEPEKKVIVPSSPVSNRMVTDSEGGSTVSNNRELLSMLEKKQPPEVPAAIVTKPKRKEKEKLTGSPIREEASRKKEKTKTLRAEHDSKSSRTMPAIDYDEEDSDEEPMLESDNSIASESTADSATDDEEVMMWASKMFGVPMQSPSSSTEQEETLQASTNASEAESSQLENNQSPRKPLKLRLKISPEKKMESTQQDGLDLDLVKRDQLRLKKAKQVLKAKKDKMMALINADNPTDQQPKLAVRGRPKLKTSRVVVELTPEEQEREEEEARREREEEKRIREEAKPLTAAQIRDILGEDDFQGSTQSNWVRRSVRRPNRALLNSKPIKALVHGLKHNDPDMVVLKMKKYINDPNAPSVVLDAALEALEENSNCQVLYIQNFNEGLRDKQVMHLLRILQSPQCKIWCMNIGENYNVATDTWEKFTEGLRRTKITHMYASEHTITSEMKDEIRRTIRENRKKHNMHISPENLDVIIQCTHCWWNPINAKSLRPYLTKRGFEHILTDMEAQGLRGSSSSAPTI